MRPSRPSSTVEESAREGPRHRPTSPRAAVGTDRRNVKPEPDVQDPTGDGQRITDRTAPEHRKQVDPSEVGNSQTSPSRDDDGLPVDPVIGPRIGGPPARDPDRPAGRIGPYDVVVHTDGRPVGHTIGHKSGEPAPLPRNPNRPVGRIGPYGR